MIVKPGFAQQVKNNTLLEKQGLSFGSALIYAADLLAQEGFDTPRLDAELLLGCAAGWERVKLLTHLNDLIPLGIIEEFNNLLERRLQKEPIAYIRGVKEFYGRLFYVNKNALIPRPETELLIDMSIEWLRTQSAKSGKPFYPNIIDVGTGSGCLAITIASLWKGAEIWAVDISEKALDIARENAKRLGVFDRIKWLSGDLLTQFPKENKANLILANLPYIPTSDWEQLSPNVKMEPRLALDGGEDGLDLIRCLLMQARPIFAEPQAIFLEVAPGQEDSIKNMPEMDNYKIVEVRNDLSGIPRAVHLTQV